MGLSLSWILARPEYRILHRCGTTFSCFAKKSLLLLVSGSNYDTPELWEFAFSASFPSRTSKERVKRFRLVLHTQELKKVTD